MRHLGPILLAVAMLAACAKDVDGPLPGSPLHLAFARQVAEGVFGATLLPTSDNGVVYFSQHDDLLIRFDRDGNERSRTKVGLLDVAYVGATLGADDRVLLFGTLLKPVTVGGFALTPSGKTSAFAVILDARDVPLWAKTFGAESNADGAAVAADGSIVIGGRFDTASIDFGKGPRAGNPGKANGFVAVLETDGTERWSRALPGAPNATIDDVTLASDGSVSVIVDASLTGSFGGPTLDLRDGLNLVVVRYDLTGAFSWQRVLNGHSFGGGWSLRSTAAGDTVVVGHTGSTFVLDDGFSFQPGGLVVVLDARGVLRWGRGFVGLQGGGEPTVSSDGSISFGGVLDGTADIDGAKLQSSKGLFIVTVRDAGFLRAATIASNVGARHGSIARAGDGAYWVASDAGEAHVPLADGAIDLSLMTTGYEARSSFLARLVPTTKP